MRVRARACAVPSLCVRARVWSRGLCMHSFVVHLCGLLTLLLCSTSLATPPRPGIAAGGFLPPLLPRLSARRGSAGRDGAGAREGGDAAGMALHARGAAAVGALRPPTRLPARRPQRAAVCRMHTHALAINPMKFQPTSLGCCCSFLFLCRHLFQMLFLLLLLLKRLQQNQISTTACWRRCAECLPSNCRVSCVACTSGQRKIKACAGV